MNEVNNIFQDEIIFDERRRDIIEISKLWEEIKMKTHIVKIIPTMFQNTIPHNNIINLDYAILYQY